MKLLTALRVRFADWIIARAMKTPYWHLTNRDGSPYMNRYWVARFGDGGLNDEGERVPWIALRVHWIRSGDDGRDYHDHPWNFVSWILRGGYHEERPVTAAGGVMGTGAEEYRADPAGPYARHTYLAGDVLFRKATNWHRLRLPGEYRDTGTWTLVLTFPVAQKWGFLVDGRKVLSREYFKARKFAQAMSRVRLYRAPRAH